MRWACRAISIRVACTFDRFFALQTFSLLFTIFRTFYQQHFPQVFQLFLSGFKFHEQNALNPRFTLSDVVFTFGAFSFVSLYQINPSCTQSCNVTDRDCEDRFGWGELRANMDRSWRLAGSSWGPNLWRSLFERCVCRLVRAGCHKSVMAT